MPANDEDGGGFLARWSRRKALERQGLAAGEPPAPPVVSVAPAGPPARPGPAEPLASAGAAPAAAPTPAPPAAAEPPPTLAEAAALGRDSDYTRFVARGVDPAVKNTALKRLFSDPHFNVMDGLDTYIDDYGRPDPLPAGLLRQMAQAQALGLFRDEAPAPEAAPAAAVPLPTEPQPDDHADLRLQPLDAAGPPGPGAGPGEDAGCPHRGPADPGQPAVPA